MDEVIVSVGVSPNPLIPRAFGGLEVSKKGTIVVEEDSMRSALGDVYAGGDIVRGGATVILAMGDGPIASLDIPERFRWLTAIRSASIQTSRPHPGFSNDLEQTFERLFQELVL